VSRQDHVLHAHRVRLDARDQSTKLVGDCDANLRSSADQKRCS
jgi:hypothetical protein